MGWPTEQLLATSPRSESAAGVRPCRSTDAVPAPGRRPLWDRLVERPKSKGCEYLEQPSTRRGVAGPVERSGVGPAPVASRRKITAYVRRLLAAPLSAGGQGGGQGCGQGAGQCCGHSLPP